MPLELSSAIAQAKNKLSDPGAWLVLLEIDVPALGEDSPLRLVRNTEDIEWDGETWTAFPFELGEAKQSADGSIQTVAVNVSNIFRQVEKYVNLADGGADSTVTLRVVYSEELDEDEVLREVLRVGPAKCTNEWVTFEIQPPAWLNQLFPKDIFDRIKCKWKFGDRGCGYIGDTYTTCNNILSDCIKRGRVSNFRGTPGLPDGTLDEAAIVPSTAE